MINPLPNWQKFCDSVEGKNSTRQLAAGVVFGMIIGLLPKDSVLVVVGVVCLILSPANLLSAGISAVIFSFFGSIPLINSAMHSLGMGVLGQNFVASTLQTWWTLPLIPWTRIDNSIVVGAISLWAILLIPVYLVSGKFFDQFGDTIYQTVRESSAFCWVIGAKKTKLNEG